jgi:hypothetical protein
MKTTLVVVIVILMNCFTKEIKAQIIMNLQIKFDDSVEVAQYTPENNDLKYQFVEIDHVGYKINNQTTLKILNQETIAQVDLVYTQLPFDYDMAELNRKRIIEFYMNCPNAFKGRPIIWRIVKQTGVNKPMNLDNFFNGFVIYYRPMVSFEEESIYFESILSQKRKLDDTTLLNIIRRNNNWKQMLCVVDVTGSMSPYTVQLLVWAKFNEKLKTFKQFVFFSDDDEKSNDQVTKLDTTGIWSIESYNADKIHDKMLKCMANGGDIENDLEAIFYAVKKYPTNIKNIVLIADNWENPCDMNLLAKLKKLKIPIRIVVCGVNKAINTNYLDIAHATNGSIHTIEEDLTEMGKITNGKIFKIQGIKYKLVAGHFQQL